MKASRLSCLVRSTIAHASQRGFVVRPAAADLDPDLQIDLAAEKGLHVETRGGGDSLQLAPARSEEHTSELQSPVHLVCRLLLEKKKKKHIQPVNDAVLAYLHAAYIA